MGDALGQGWLIQLIIALPALAGSLIVTLRWARKQWASLVARKQAEKEELVAALERKSREVIAAYKTLAHCEIQRDALISEVRLWRAGKTPEADERFR